MFYLFLRHEVQAGGEGHGHQRIEEDGQDEAGGALRDAGKSFCWLIQRECLGYVVNKAKAVFLRSTSNYQYLALSVYQLVEDKFRTTFLHFLLYAVQEWVWLRL
jgi:hypothetical protein